jgi:hypothetical protein
MNQESFEYTHLHGRVSLLHALNGWRVDWTVKDGRPGGPDAVTEVYTGLSWSEAAQVIEDLLGELVLRVERAERWG